jgi:hypothetical protein
MVMPGDSNELPFCSRRLSSQEVAQYMRLALTQARFRESIAESWPPDADPAGREAL